MQYFVYSNVSSEGKNIPWRDQLSESRYLPACVLNRGVKFDNNSYCVHRN